MMIHNTCIASALRANNVLSGAFLVPWYNPLMIHRFAHRMATSPVWQYHFHMIMTMVWLLGMIVAPALYWPQYVDQWATLGLLEISLWANVATHFGAMSSALAALNSEPDPLPTALDLSDLPTNLNP